MLFTKFTYLSYGSINYKRDVNFVNNVTITLLGEEMIKIKVVCHDEFYNFHVHDFSAEFNYCFKILFKVLKFKFLIDKTKSQEKMAKIIAVRTQ